LDGALHLLLLAMRDVVSDCFCSALHRFRGHIQAGQDLDLFATVIEGNALAHKSLHDRTKPARVDYAIVIDAKYTSRINQRHQDGVRNYNEIRSTDNDRPVVTTCFSILRSIYFFLPYLLGDPDVWI
jgi:hypothetical protein